MIDPKKPLRLSNGTPAKIVGEVRKAKYGARRNRPYALIKILGQYRSDKPYRNPLSFTYYFDTGEFAGGGAEHFRLENVPEGPQVGDTLTCFGLEAIIKAESAEHFYAHSSQGYVYAVDKDTMRDQSNDPWAFTPPVTETTEWVNVYADGTVGTNTHADFETAVNATQFGRVRIGIIERVRRNGGIVAAKVHPTTPQLRDRNVTAHNPFAG